jgi:putative MATE family efflux protein
MDRTKALAVEPVGRLMWRYFMPAFVGVMANALYNIVDRIFIGRGVGSQALSGLGVTFPIMLIIMGFGMLIGVGAGVLVSIRLGEQKRGEADKVLGTTLFLILIVSTIIVTLVYLTKGSLLASFGATAETIEYADQYLTIILIGTFFTMPGYSLNNIIRSEGNARIAMYSMLISSLTNVVLDYLFIMVFGWGVSGAALATVISMFVLFVWVMLHFTGKRNVVTLHWRHFRFDPVVSKSIIAIGMAPFAMQIASSVVQGLSNTLLIKHGGDLAVGAFSIVISVISLVVMSVIAINMAAQPIMGYNYGAKNYTRVQSALKISLIAATLLSIGAWVVTQWAPEYIVALFNNNDPELTALTTHALQTITILFPIVGFQIVGGNFFQSIGKARISMFLTLLRQVLMLIPMLLILPHFMGLDGVWLSFPISDVVSATVVAFFLASVWRKLKLQTL